MRLNSRPCQWCGVLFRPRPRGRKFCQFACYTAARRLVLPQGFWARVAVLGPDDCWLWQGRVNPYGYGEVWLPGAYVRAHRLAWELTYGAITSGLQILHQCEGRYPPGDFTCRRCCNPHHLRAGTHEENMADKSRTGRNRGPRFQQPGETNPNAVLSRYEVQAIRLAWTGGVGIARLALVYGVTRNTIRLIVKGKTWRC